MSDDEEGIPGSDGGQVSVHPADDVGDRFSGGDQNAKQFLSPGKQSSILLHIVIHFDDPTPSQQLHDQSTGDNGRDAKLHERAPIGGEDDTHPVEGIGGFGRLDSIEGDLAADEEDEEGYCCPEDFFAEGDLDSKRGGEHGRQQR